MSAPTGYTCAKCGKEHTYTVFVLAHWDELLTHACSCGAKVDIIRGIARKAE